MMDDMKIKSMGMRVRSFVAWLALRIGFVLMVSEALDFFLEYLPSMMAL